MKHLIGSLVLAVILASGVNSSSAAPAAKREQRIAIAVTSNGFEPSTIHLKAGRPVRFVVTRRTDSTCATEIVVKAYGIKKALPLNQPVEVRFTPRRAGTVRYACGMDMVAGNLIVE